MVDRVGPQRTSFIGSVIVSMGLLLLAVASPNFDVYIPAMLLLGCGGSAILLCGFAVMARSASPHRTAMMGIVGYAFDLGACVFSVWDLFVW